jgi:transposase
LDANIKHTAAAPVRHTRSTDEINRGAAGFGCDTNGLPVRLALTTGEAHDNRIAGKLLSRLKSGAMLLADRGYDAEWSRTLATEKGAWANIPPRSNRNDPICFSP